MIYFNNVSKFFKNKDGSKHYLLKNVNLLIEEKNNIAILGKNGAGKSTLMRMIGGIEPISSGSISSNYSFSWPMGVSGGLQGSMTGEQNVKFVCMIYGKTEEETDNIISFVKDFSEIEHFFYEPIKNYSSGMKSRLTLGLSLAFNFDYYLIDEILSVGDLSFKNKSKEAIEQKIKNNNIIMVSHSMSSLKDFCSVSLVLDKGHLYFYNTVDEGIKHYNDLNLKVVS